MASPIVNKVLDRIEGEKSLNILESNFNTSRPKLWARAKELAEERFGVYGIKAHSWAYKWYEKKGGTFIEHHQKDADGNEIPHEEIEEAKVDTVKHGVMDNPEKEKARNARKFGNQRFNQGGQTTLRRGLHWSKRGEKKVRGAKEIEEASTTTIPAQNGNVYELMYSWRGKTYFCKMFFPQPGKPSKDEVQAALTKVYPSAILRNCYISSINYGDPYIHVGQGDGFTAK